jgi:mono/diheme cytochrome c family protein
LNKQTRKARIKEVRVTAREAKRWMGFVLLGLASAIAPAPVLAQDREALVAQGKALFTQKGCYECHTVGNIGALIAPDLSRAGVKHREGDLTRWLSRPSTEEPTEGGRLRELEPAESDMAHLRPHMPTLKLSETEAQALAAYLASLR